MQKEVKVDPVLVSMEEKQGEAIESVDLEENKEDIVEVSEMAVTADVEESKGGIEDKIHHKLKAHKIGDISLTVTTLVLVIICLCFDKQFAPFIVLLMASRIGSSIYMVIKDFSKQECRKLIVWCALFGKSALTCWQFFMV